MMPDGTGETGNTMARRVLNLKAEGTKTMTKSEIITAVSEMRERVAYLAKELDRADTDARSFAFAPDRAWELHARANLVDRMETIQSLALFLGRQGNAVQTAAR